MTSRRIVVHGVSYRIDKQIGHGLHSLVYGGQDLSDGRPVALKITNFLHGSFDVKARTESRRQSFWKEIEMLLYLQPLNPYIIRVLNYDFTDSYGVIVMERGKTFRDTLVEYMFGRKQMPKKLVRRFWSQMVDAIAHMHRTGIVHSDVKPENFIQVGADGSIIRLIDMGISFQLPPNVTSRLKTATGTPGKILMNRF
jgi:serine/threonine protein kinase